MIEEWVPGCYRVCHGHAITLTGKNITWQQIHYLKVLRLAEAMPARIRVREHLPKLGIHIIICQFGFYCIGEEHLELRRQLPARKVREEGISQVLLSGPKETLQIGFGLLLNVSKIWINPFQ